MSAALPLSQDFEHLYGNHHHWLLAWVNWRLGNAADAADLAHDAFVRLLTRPCHFDTPQQARSYLRKMANGMCVDLWRRRSLEQAWLDTLAKQPEPTVSSAEDQAMVLEALGEIDTMLRELPPKVAHAFVMAVACEMTDQEVADTLKVSARMVRKYVARAMLCCMKLEARLAAGLSDDTTNDLSHGQADRVADESITPSPATT
ncbi:sigma-70 family RNA polymerase sigma factor [Achromobacter spanius]|uniref:sigma-70 family RNA polymerase sigma factor n=1 Tax=Achromobacter sp. SS2-2022 TaxID=2980498 RepID=UPI002DD44637|nr:sigma-70 family RNA polymerase sigma factor [Achromobacter spanius]